MRLILILLFMMPVYSLVSAETSSPEIQALRVKLNIDGVRYFCSTNPGQPPRNCDLQALDGRYKVCKQSNSASYCFRDVFASRPAGCDADAWGNLCNRLCVESNSSSLCYRKCYQQ